MELENDWMKITSVIIVLMWYLTDKVFLDSSEITQLAVVNFGMITKYGISLPNKEAVQIVIDARKCRFIENTKSSICMIFSFFLLHISVAVS